MEMHALPGRRSGILTGAARTLIKSYRYEPRRPAGNSWGYSPASAESGRHQGVAPAGRRRCTSIRRFLQAEGQRLGDRSR